MQKRMPMRWSRAALCEALHNRLWCAGDYVALWLKALLYGAEKAAMGNIITGLAGRPRSWSVGR